MRTYAFEKREDGSLKMDNPIVVDSENIPEGLFLADPEKTYDYLGYEIEPPEPSPPEPTLEEKNRADIDYIAIMTGVEL